MYIYIYVWYLKWINHIKTTVAFPVATNPARTPGERLESRRDEGEGSSDGQGVPAVTGRCEYWH